MATTTRAIILTWGITGATITFTVYSNGTSVTTGTATETSAGSGIYRFIFANTWQYSWGETQIDWTDGTIKFSETLPALPALDSSGNPIVGGYASGQDPATSILSANAFGSITVQRLFKELAAFHNGKIAETDNGDGTKTLSIYDTDNATVLFTCIFNSTTGARAAAGTRP